MNIEKYPSSGIKISNIGAQVLAESQPRYDIYKLLDRIRPFSNLYIENNGALGLATLILVYETAMQNAGVVDSSKPAFADFSQFVRSELGYTHLSVDWSLMILASAMGFLNDDVDWERCTDDVSAKHSRETIEEFYRLLDIYRTK